MTAESAESLEANLDDDIGLVEATVLKLLNESVDVGDRVSCRTLGSEGAVSPPLRSRGLGNLVFCRDVEVELYVVERTRVVGCGDFVLAVEDNVVTHIGCASVMLRKLLVKLGGNHILCSLDERSAYELSVHKKLRLVEIVFLTDGDVGGYGRDSTFESLSTLGRFRCGVRIKSDVLCHYLNVSVTLQSGVSHIERRLERKDTEAKRIALRTRLVREHDIFEEG